MMKLFKASCWVIVASFLGVISIHSNAKSAKLESILRIDESGRLQYVPDDKGNILPDFSYSGYKKSEEPIPYIETTLTLQPVNGDNTEHIQKAIDKLSQLPLQKNGFRGALLLDRGVYSVSGQLVIRSNGIVLRGTGREKTDTVIFAAGKDKRSLIHVQGELNLSKQNKFKQKITNAYVPVGVRSITVADTAGFSVGQQVMIIRPSTSQWITDIGMDKIPKRKDGKPIKQWQAGKYDLNYERTITKIDGNEIFLDIPLVQMMEDQYGGGYIYPVTISGRVAHVGIENMLLVSQYKKGQIDSDEAHSWVAIEISDAENVWVSDITSRHFARSLVSVKRGSRFVTVKDAIALDPASLITGSRRYSFYLEGAQALFLRCYARNGRHDFITSSRVAGPSAFVYSEAQKTHSDIGPHHRWATGILYDNVKGGDVNIQDRGNRGSGHGWTGAQQVLWNTQGSRTSVQSPPGAINWSIGHVGKRWRGRSRRPEGIWVSAGKPVKPESLFVQQLKDRIGAKQAELILAKR